jgi:glutamate decarboxylase
VKNWEETRMFLQKIVEILLDYIREENDRSSKILEFHHPAEMLQILDLSIPDKPMTLSELLNVALITRFQILSIFCFQCCREVLKLGVKTGHPRFFNQISCGLDLVSMAGEWLTATANTNM